MDTPERSKIGPPANSKFEDSPVFNFINNLSPIQPVKSEDSVHNVQAYQSLNFASISSIFTSPHVNPQKDSRLLIRHPFSELSKHETSSDNVDESNLSIGVSSTVRLSRCAVIARESCSVICSLNEATVDPPDECPTLPDNLPQGVQYGTGSPDHNTTPCYGIKMGLKLDRDHTPIELVHFVQDGVEKRKSLFSAQCELQDNHTPEQNKDDMVGCDWENLISDDADGLLIFDTSIESEAYQGADEKLGDHDSVVHNSFSSKVGEDVDNSQRTQPDDSLGPCVQTATQDPPVNQSGEAVEDDETDHTPQMLSGILQNQPVLDDQSQEMAHGASDCNPVGYKVDSRQQRGMRRRCLVFELAGVSRRNLHKESNPRPSKTLSSNDNMVSGDKNLKPGSSPLPRLLPGIGLHLNTLAATTKDKMITQETLASGKQIISMPCSFHPFRPTIEGQSTLKPLAIEKDLDLSGGELQECQVVHDDSSQAPSVGRGEESSHGSPKKKRRKSENGGESDGCKRCNCKKSKCLKLYCECFAAGVYCSEPCSCHGCFNKPIHEETVLATRKQIESRNPLAFAPKVIRTCETGQEMGEDANKTPASARHKKGCNCKKSSCLKKYCECYQGGVGCSISCRCEGCKNAFGRKDVGAEEVEQGEEDTDACETERDRSDDGLQHANVKTDELLSSEVILPITPLQTSRSLIAQPVFSSSKPPRSSKLSVGFSAQLYSSQLLQKSEIMLSQHQFEKHVDMLLEDDTPDILKGNTSPSNGVKIASPNRKRISPPHNGIGLSPSRKGGRKLILKSIPSFPSLSTEVPKEYPINTASSSSVDLH